MEADKKLNEKFNRFRQIPTTKKECLTIKPIDKHLIKAVIILGRQ